MVSHGFFKVLESKACNISYIIKLILRGWYFLSLFAPILWDPKSNLHQVLIYFCFQEDASGPRQVHHFQYISWPDKGVPEHATSVLGFRRKVRAHYTATSKGSPLLVHCR